VLVLTNPGSGSLDGTKRVKISFLSRKYHFITFIVAIIKVKFRTFNVDFF